MEHSKPHEIVNRLFEARDGLRSHITLETAIIERIAQLPDDDFCSTDRESLQLGAGYAQLLHEGQLLSYPGQIETEYTMSVLQVFFAIQPINRYLHEHEVYEQQKQVYEVVLNPAIGVPNHLDPYKVSAATCFLEGFTLVTVYHTSQDSV